MGRRINNLILKDQSEKKIIMNKQAGRNVAALIPDLRQLDLSGDVCDQIKQEFDVIKENMASSLGDDYCSLFTDAEIAELQTAMDTDMAILEDSHGPLSGYCGVSFCGTEIRGGDRCNAGIVPFILFLLILLRLLR